MAITKKQLKTAAQKTAAFARAAGLKMAEGMALAADAALVEAGHQAQRRQRRRAGSKTLRLVKKTTLVVGAALATRAAIRRLRKAADEWES